MGAIASLRQVMRQKRKCNTRKKRQVCRSKRKRSANGRQHCKKRKKMRRRTSIRMQWQVSRGEATLNVCNMRYRCCLLTGDLAEFGEGLTREEIGALRKKMKIKVDGDAVPEPFRRSNPPPLNIAANISLGMVGSRSSLLSMGCPPISLRTSKLQATRSPHASKCRRHPTLPAAAYTAMLRNAA